MGMGMTPDTSLQVDQLLNEDGPATAAIPDPDADLFFDVSEDTTISWVEQTGGMGMGMSETQEQDVTYVGQINSPEYGILYVFTTNGVGDAGGMFDYIIGSNNPLPDGVDFAAISDITAVSSPVCFLAGTLLRTPTGESPIETLQAGDLVLTANGAKSVKFIARSTRMTNTLKAFGKMPIRIQASALGEGLPRLDTWMSPSHALFLDNHLIEAAALINETTIVQEQTHSTPLLTYYNIELDDHEVIWANGMPVETYFSSFRNKGFSRDTWDNYEDYLELYGSSELMEELSYPRIPFARQLPEVIRQRVGIQVADLALVV